VTLDEPTSGATGSREAPSDGPSPGHTGRSRLSPAGRAALRVALVSLAVLGADQLSKALVRSSIPLGSERKVLPGLLAFVHTLNRGVAFGIDPGGSAAVALLVAAAVAALLVYFARHATRPLLWLPTGLLLGGAIGNVIDRLRLGAVTDFVKLPLGWPPFNVADACISVGVVILVVLVGFERR